MDFFDDFVEPAMEGHGATGAQESVPVAGAAEPDPNWQPV